MTASPPVRRGVAMRGLAGDGRPLRFLMIVLGGWTGARIALLWGDPVAEQVIAARNPEPVAARTSASVAPQFRFDPAPDQSPMVAFMVRRDAARPILLMPPSVATPPAAAALVPAGRTVSIATDAALRVAPVIAAARVDAAHPVVPMVSDRPRWSGSGWALVRGSAQAGGVATPQLGGSQIGVRVAYRIDDAARLAAVGRVAAALGTRQQEAALGLEWQPTRWPIRVVAEQRFGIAGIAGGPALGLVGGAGALSLGAGIHADGYAQAGVVARDRIDGYVDGALVVGRTVAARGSTQLELGLGAWGAAQRSAARLDLGPSAVLVLPVERRGLRVGVQWRARVAGDARPGSGAVLSLGADW